MNRNHVIPVVAMLAALSPAWIATLSTQEELGKNLFNDPQLSTPPGQACAACHAPESGWTGPISSINANGAVYPGAVHSRFGGRKPPSSAYASYAPPLTYDPDEDIYFGGQFWDGRAADLVAQAKGPFLNPLEQNNPSPKHVVLKVSQSDYASLFPLVYGPNSLDPVKDVSGSYHRIALAIAAYEASPESNAFTSKFDHYVAGQVSLTAQEAWGLELFNAPAKGNCAACHPSTPGPFADKALFTDYTYDNLGTPKNPKNPFYGMPTSVNPAGFGWLDMGLYFTTGREVDKGKFKVPTLRNVARRPNSGFVKAFGHNGYFKSLKEIVHFYNTRDVNGWPPAEVPMNVNDEELGNLGLSDAEEDAIVAFLETLTDGYALPPG